MARLDQLNMAQAEAWLQRALDVARRPFPPLPGAHPVADSPPPAVPPARSRPAVAASPAWAARRPALRAAGGGRAAG